MGFNSGFKGLITVQKAAPLILTFNPLNAEFNPICHLLVLLGAHPILHISRIRVKNRASYIKDGRTATLQMLHFIYFSTNISNKYFKHAAHFRFSLQNAIYFIMLSLLVPVLFIFYIQGVLKLRCQKVNICWSNLSLPWDSVLFICCSIICLRFSAVHGRCCAN